jgi:hypothetical protein
MKRQASVGFISRDRYSVAMEDIFYEAGMTELSQSRRRIMTESPCESRRQLVIFWPVIKPVVYLSCNYQRGFHLMKLWNGFDAVC